jgi:Ca2+-binding EF-hand superfamily protein
MLKKTTKVLTILIPFLGQISVDELKNILKSSHSVRGIDVDLNEEYVEKILNRILGEADENEDGLLSCKGKVSYIYVSLF